mmetsp:Transcript_20558/g.44929  ORF Transcript_20558/g.44929 Transcript_20558/m.44929 type:complete len:605 (+) Transcript_20558:173-1987(+)
MVKRGPRQQPLSAIIYTFALGTLCGIFIALSVLLVFLTHNGASAQALFGLRVADATGRSDSQITEIKLPDRPLTDPEPAAGSNKDARGLVVKTQDSAASKKSNYPYPTDPSWYYPEARTVNPPKTPLNTASVILACRNEHRYLQNTIDFLIENTPQEGLKEIIVVDDASVPTMASSMAREPSSYGSVLRFIVKDKSDGLMNARLSGARAAEGDVFVFLDCHVRATKGWLEPILKHVNENFRRVVTPSIPALDENFTLIPGTDTIGQFFEWSLDTFHWLSYDYSIVLVMAGGLFAMSKEWWFESGEYDTGMRGWGTEQFEQSIRIWCCGGEIVLDRASVIGHRYRSKDTEPVPYVNPEGSGLLNKVRAAELWLDDHKFKFYKSHPDGKALLEKNFDISAMQKLKKDLQCKPFQWFVNQFRAVFLAHSMIVDDFAVTDCTWHRYEKKFIGIVAWMEPEFPPKDHLYSEVGKEAAVVEAKARCAAMGVICAGITCDDKACTPRKGQWPNFLKESETEVSYIKHCCHYAEKPGYYFSQEAFLGPVIQRENVRATRENIAMVFNRCEALSELCAGVTCDETSCSAREGKTGLLPSPAGEKEISYVKQCH